MQSKIGQLRGFRVGVNGDDATLFVKFVEL
jgi:hypothetical protein